MSEVEILDITGVLKRNLIKHFIKEIEQLIIQAETKGSINVDYSEISRWGKEGLHIADKLLYEPEYALGEIHKILAHLLKDRGYDGKFKVRVYNLPRSTPIRDLRSKHVGRLLALEGLVKKATRVKPKVTCAYFICKSCGHRSRPIPQLKTQKLRKPGDCPMCNRTKWSLDMDKSYADNFQKILLQERPEGLRGGELPADISCELIGDICGKISAGDHVTCNGILHSIQSSEDSGVLELVFEVLSVEKHDDAFEEVEINAEEEEKIRKLAEDPNIYSMLITSIAPTIYNYESIKLALTLALFGGIQKRMPDGTRIRSDIHVLLVGDPGIAKSVLIRYCTGLSFRGVFTSGKSTTAAGLTATAVKDDFGEGQWTLEAGAMVLADMGVCGVDELDKMPSDQRSAMHEAMEQQTISVAKAGINTVLQSRCAVLAAANPKLGRFDAFAPLAEQINMPPSLLSRFDLIFVVMDIADTDKDKRIAEHILKTHKYGEVLCKGEETNEEILPTIGPELLRKYISYAKKTCQPQMGEEAGKELVDYYLSLREIAAKDKTKPVPVTARQLEALIRLAEASAKVRLSPIIELEDAQRVIALVDMCLRQVAYDKATESFDIDRVVTAIPKSKRDKVKFVKEIVKRCADEWGTAKLEAVISQLETAGKMTREQAMEAVDLACQAGECFQPKRGQTIRTI